MKAVFESKDWESLILGYDEAGREAAEAFKDAFQFDVNPLEKLEDFPAMLDSVAGSEAVKNAKRVYDDALEAWTNGGDESITLNQL